MPRNKSNGKQVPVTSLKHKDKRTNIPTRELQNFVKDEEKSPKTVSYPGLLYARDPSLDPQLVWKGKDEQDSRNLWVPAINKHGGFGRWAFIEITDPWDAKNTIRATLRSKTVESVGPLCQQRSTQ